MEMKRSRLNRWTFLPYLEPAGDAVNFAAE
jgi:hypothetical protein